MIEQNTSKQVCQKHLRYEQGKKSIGLAYLIGFFFSWLGLHRFYCKDIVGGIAYIVLFFTVLTISPTSLTVFLILCAYTLFDGFYTYFMVKNYNKQLFKDIWEV